jgi:coenzyme F420-reducing hydrogenase alpha subunit
LIASAQIVPPTSQNQLSIEEDLRGYVPGRTHLSDEDLRWQLEQAIRNYDPCISCATHFLDLEVDRT